MEGTGKNTRYDKRIEFVKGEGPPELRHPGMAAKEKHYGTESFLKLRQ